MANARDIQLDALRAIAVMLVLYSHFLAPGGSSFVGHLGVRLFFVLSGFLITGLLLDARDAGACAAGAALRSLVPPAAIQAVQLVAAAWLVILGCRLIAVKRADVAESGGTISILATTALNPKAFIYCVAIVPMDIEAAALGGAWIALLAVTVITGAMWLLLGGRLRGGKRMADTIAGAALIAFALLLVRPLIPLSGI